MADNYVRQGQTFRAKDVGGTILAPILMAGEHVRVYDGTESLALSASAGTLTVPGSATHATVYAEGATTDAVARYWEGGTVVPTASVGKRLYDHEEINLAAPSSFKAINSSGTTTLRIAYYHYS